MRGASALPSGSAVALPADLEPTGVLRDKFIAAPELVGSAGLRVVSAAAGRGRSFAVTQEGRLIVWGCLAGLARARPEHLLEAVAPRIGRSGKSVPLELAQAARRAGCVVPCAWERGAAQRNTEGRALS